ncbi:MAG: hypothetical protein KGL74_09535, partial [Elusimicrobia bacterium]|nr:hypothetical protein [Elusimicrobiota bacterium]
MIPPRFAVFLAVAAAAFLLPSSALAAPTVSDDGRRAAFSPEEVRRSDSRALAETLVRRLHRFCDLAGVP